MSPPKKVSKFNRLDGSGVARRHMLYRSIPCLEHGQEVGVVIAHVLPPHELEHLRSIATSIGWYAWPSRDGQKTTAAFFSPHLCPPKKVSNINRLITFSVARRKITYIAVKFGAARRKWIGSEEGRFAGEGQLGTSSTGAKAH